MDYKTLEEMMRHHMFKSSTELGLDGQHSKVFEQLTDYCRTGSLEERELGSTYLRMRNHMSRDYEFECMRNDLNNIIEVYSKE